MEKNQSTSSNAPLITIITVFFFWGFLAASNGIFIPFCKTHFNLNQFQSQLIDTAFYAAYFFGSFALWLASQMSKIDFLNKMGYKKGIIYGLFISVVGALLMIPALNSGSFEFILGAFFVIALGFSLQQTAANPFVVALGNPEGGSHRLNLAGSLNSFGTLLGPVLVGYLLFGDLNKSAESSATTASVSSLYWMLAGVFLAAALLLYFSKLPVVNSTEPFEPGLGVFKFSQLKWGMVAIFVYVGVEVTIQSNLGALLKTPDFGGLEDSQISPFISLYWGSLMIGRWAGAVSAFNLQKNTKIILTIILPYIAFGLFLFVNNLRGSDVTELYSYAFCIAILIAGIFMSQEKPARMLFIFSVLGMVAMLVGLFTTGTISLFAFLCGGLCCSIGWPCIFAMSITGLGKFTGQGSSFLIMMILGGALIPPLQGYIADQTDIHSSYWVAVVCFAFLAWFALKVKRDLKNQGVDIDKNQVAGH
ncbi:MAG: MFS transporter [Bacteroidia bacterium]